MQTRCCVELVGRLRGFWRFTISGLFNFRLSSVWRVDGFRTIRLLRGVRRLFVPFFPDAIQYERLQHFIGTGLSSLAGFIPVTFYNKNLPVTIVKVQSLMTPMACPIVDFDGGILEPGISSETNES